LTADFADCTDGSCAEGSYRDADGQGEGKFREGRRSPEAEAIEQLMRV
jgi:hypothetical protein